MIADPSYHMVLTARAAGRHCRVCGRMAGYGAVPDRTGPRADLCWAGHCLAEPRHICLLKQRGLDFLLSRGMRLGGGGRAALDMSVIRAALVTHNGMATFAEAGGVGSL